MTTNTPVDFAQNGLTVKGPTQVQAFGREPVNLAIVASAVAVDLSRSSHFRLAITEDVTVSNPTGIKEGQEFVMVITQDATGGRGITWGSAFDWGSQPPDFTNDAALSVTVVRGLVISSTLIMMEATRGEGASATDFAIDDLTAGTINGVEILSGTADPTAGGGVAHTLHALYFRNASGTLTVWYATGAGATAWAAFDPLD